MISLAYKLGIVLPRFKVGDTLIKKTPMYSDPTEFTIIRMTKEKYYINSSYAYLLDGLSFADLEKNFALHPKSQFNLDLEELLK